MFWNSNNKKRKPEDTYSSSEGRTSDTSKVCNESSSPEEKTSQSCATKGTSDCATPERSLERFGKVRSALGSGTVIQGKLSFDTPVRIDGKLAGEVFSTDALIVGESGAIEANIEAASLIVLGKVKGVIKVSQRIEILKSGSIEGEISTPNLVIESGALFNGSVTMLSTQAVQDVRSEVSRNASSEWINGAKRTIVKNGKSETVITEIANLPSNTAVADSVSAAEASNKPAEKGQKGTGRASLH